MYRIVQLIILSILIASCNKVPSNISSDSDISKLRNCYDRLQFREKKVQIAHVINYYQFSKSKKALFFLSDQIKEMDVITIDVVRKSRDVGIELPLTLPK
jgi:hypothetical protein